MNLPHIPPWDAIHPALVHLPIGALTGSLLLLLIATVWPGKGRWFSAAAVVMMTLGTVSGYVTINSGEAAAEIAPHDEEIHEHIEAHEELAEQTMLYFAILTGVFAVVVITLAAMKKPPRAAHVIAHVIVLAAYLFGLLMLVNTSELGGRLVHSHGVLAPLDGTAPLPTPTHEHDDHDD